MNCKRPWRYNIHWEEQFWTHQQLVLNNRTVIELVNGGRWIWENRHAGQILCEMSETDWIIIYFLENDLFLEIWLARSFNRAKCVKKFIVEKETDRKIEDVEEKEVRIERLEEGHWYFTDSNNMAD